MTKYIVYLSVAVAAIGSFSCRKYVEVEQPNQRVLKYTSDYQALLNNVTVFEGGYNMPMLSESDVDAGNSTAVQNRLTNELGNIYTWAADYYTGAQTDGVWTQQYNVIYECNAIVNGVMSSLNGTDAQKQTIYAEALAQRAYTYLMLLNMYAPVYNQATASTDLGLPLLLSPDLFVDLTRSSVQTVYDQILQDVTTALPNLLDHPSNNLHAGKAAGYATLARMYLYMQNYAKAGENAAMALRYQDSLLNLSAFGTTLTGYPRRLQHPELILCKKGARLGFFSLPLSNELLSYFSANDLRYTLYTRDGSNFSPSFTGRGSFKYNLFANDDIAIGVSVPEMMLIQAEGLARNNQPSEAMALVNKLRQKRFKAADYVALSANTGTEALNIVLAERRRELFGTGLRWFDQRRLSREPALATTVTRAFKGNNYTLEPGSNRFVYPIAPYYIQLNPEIQQNKR
ncbi:hypothetical protein HNQ91_000984 [Filimonas zeae]|uniref:SusD family protein n=1 Tax=Filimonas zeae TaxID=1737353 RepID=A0A917IRG3_9BACT|nr:RagB/SusD family nutrient uptake outer membrane protein [Filimonas zeae]MDR6337962.1 hypothetical protein [Filimonas zeae]GGH61055.1 hypothetical protein GCM10011379_09630 [Filimonas zeae]